MALGFQSQVYVYPAPAVVGARASLNPTSTVDAGPLGLTAGVLGVIVGKFAWVSYAVAGGPGVANNFSPTVPTAPNGFVCNEQQALITTWLGINGLAIPPGYPVTLFGRGDFWARSIYADAAIGQKVFANLFSGDVYPAAAGAFVSAAVGSSAVLASVSFAANSYTMTINTITSGTVAIGQQVVGVNVPFNCYIESAGTLPLPASSGSGTVNVTAAPPVAITTQPMTTIANVGIGGAVCSSVSSASSTTLTINTVTSGAIAVGQMIQAITNIPAGTYVSSIGTFNGTSGTIIMSAASTGTITAQACNFSAWIETPWYFTSPGNAGDLCKIGILN